MDKFDLYEDIATRTGGDIYVGVVGPVRTGKSTFISKFMEALVLPNIEDENRLQRVIDEMPQSADGRTIMTTQPKFVPDDGVRIRLGENNLGLNVRLIDCVGYIVDSAMGHKEDGKVRLVRTPWDEEELPFEKAAEIGTQKVIADHSTIGIVMTTDGSISDIPRADYVAAEERVIRELKEIGKPFTVILNSKKPEGKECRELAKALSEKYDVTVMPKNVLAMSEADVTEILSGVLMEFPVKTIEMTMPKWLQCLPRENAIIASVLAELADKVCDMVKMNDYKLLEDLFAENADIEKTAEVNVDFGTGCVTVNIVPKPHVFYKVLSETCGVSIDDDFKLMSFVKVSNYAMTEYNKLKDALSDVERTGYGVVMPVDGDIVLEEPEIMKSGGRFGVKLKASASSLHIMKVDVKTEVSPIVGTEAQSEEMLNYLTSEFENDKNGIWDTNLFGKSLNTLVKDGINNKLHNVPEDAQLKIRKTLGRIVNEGRGGVLCVLI